MKELAAGMLKVKNSKFYAHLYEIESIEDMDEILKEHRKRYKKAVHHCWAAVLEDGTTKFKDDGEVGHPGKVILEVLRKHRMKNRAIVVSRIFGGVKLGIGGGFESFPRGGRERGTGKGITRVNSSSFMVNLPVLKGEIELKQSKIVCVGKNYALHAKEMSSEIPKIMTLEPGDIIATGTPSGVEALKLGDVVK